VAKRLNDFAKKVSGYTAAAAAATVAGSAGDAQAAPIIYDTESSPIVVTTDYFAYGVNMAIIDPTMAGAPDSAGAAANGLLGLVIEDSSNGNSTVASAPSDGVVTSSSVFFRYNIFDDNSGSDKSGTQFGVLTGPGNGVYGYFDGTSAQPADKDAGDGSNGWEEYDIIGSAYLTAPDVLLTSDTNPVSGAPNSGDFPLPATVVDMDGHGVGGAGWSWDIVTGVRYLGFQLDGKNGFVKVNETGNRNGLEILGWGMETVPGAPILASLSQIGDCRTPQCVPEPSTLVLLSLGAVGLLAYRRLNRRAKRAIT
jgi:hypothetical protein